MSSEGIRLEVPFAGTVPSPVSENEGMVTGNWRTTRPVLDPEKCTQCLACWLVCPDACVTPADDVVVFNYKYCKGCSLCTVACPVGAITDLPELQFAGGEEETR